MELEELTETYEGFAKKYKIPDFNSINEDFEIDKIEKESFTFLKVVRKVMMEKIVNSLGFLEMLNNPVNAPRIYLSYLKSITSEEKKIIDDLYMKLGELSLYTLSLEIEYSEKDEAEAIKKIYLTWNSIKPDFKKIIINLTRPEKEVAKKEKSYYG